MSGAPASRRHSRAAFQLKQVCKQLAVRPIATYDSEYGNASFVHANSGIAADLLLRLRPNMCLWGAPPAYSGKGDPRCMAINLSWLTPHLGRAYCHIGERRPEVGTVQIQHGAGFHFRAEKAHLLQLLRITVSGKHSGKPSLSRCG
jgi:hypothetical protein